MFIDSNDVEHLMEQLIKELPLLSAKIVKMNGILTKKLLKLKTFENSNGIEKWRNHETNTTWQIKYYYIKENGKPLVIFFPITIIERGGVKDYLLFPISDIKQVIKKQNHAIKIIKGHFIERYRERLNAEEDKSISIIMEIHFHSNLGIIEHFEQNSKWLLYLLRWGIAMVKDNFPVLIFDTFITIDQLKQNQIEAINEYLNQLNKPEYALWLADLLENKDWFLLIKEKHFTSIEESINGGNHILPPEWTEIFIDNIKIMKEKCREFNISN